jgi:DNA-binding transcriptional regulator GbsR (MarR family)
MSAAASSDLHPVVRRFVQEAGSLTQSLGLGRVLGQIYAYLYFSQTPQSLGDLQRALGISKGGASMCVRQLEQWDAVRKVWVRGDRKDYYEANDWFGNILKKAVMDTVGKRLSSYQSLLEQMGASAANDPGWNGEGAFVQERIGRLQKFQTRAQRLWKNPLLQTLLQ